MKSFCLFLSVLFLCVLTLPAAAQPAPAGAGIQRLTFKSEVMGEERTILVRTPAGYDRSQQRFPVLYMTDGDGHIAQPVQGDRRAHPVVEGPADHEALLVGGPGGAQVTLDGRVVGRTPLSLADVPRGSHVVGIELAGYKRWATSVLVTSDRARVGASLELIVPQEGP